MLPSQDSVTDPGSPDNTSGTGSPPPSESATTPSTSMPQEASVDGSNADTSQTESEPPTESAITSSMLEEASVDGTNPDTSQTESPSESVTALSALEEGSLDTSNADASQSGPLPALKFRKSHRRKRGIVAFARRVLLSDPEEYRLLKACFAFPIGALVAGLLFCAVILPLELSRQTTKLLGTSLSFVLSFGFAFSVQVRCITCLVLPTFFSRAGRSYITAFAIVFLVSGPITNILANGREISRSLTCMSSLLVNQTWEMMKLRVLPLKDDGENDMTSSLSLPINQDAVKELQGEGFLINRIGSAVESAFAPIRTELEDDSEVKEMSETVRKAEEIVKKSEEKGAPPNPFTADDTEKKHEVNEKDDPGKQAENNWEKKLDVRCEEVFSQGIIKCRDKFGSLEQKCMDALWLLGYVLCLPLKMTFFCELVRVVPGAFGLSCDSMDVVDPGVGETYVASRQMIHEVSHGMKVRMQYKLSDLKPDVNLMSADEMRKGVVTEFETKATWVQFLMSLVQRLMAFTFLLIFKNARSYHSYFLTKFQYDNIYITQYFRRIDARRKAAGKKTLLPLKRTERQNLIFPTAVRLIRREKAAVGSGIGLLLFRIIVSGIIMYIDYLFVFVLDTVTKHSKIEYYQQGKATLEVKVHGKGFMSDIVRMFLKAFNSEHELNRVTNNFGCLPQPAHPNLWNNLLVGGTYVGIFVFSFIEAYALRMRRFTASFFYRKREKKRVLFLYNEMLKKRKGYLKLMRHRVKKEVRERELQKTIGITGGLVRSFPRLCFCLRFLADSKDSCLICKEPEKKGDFVTCPTPGCKWGYCKECWKDIKRRCYVCMEDRESDFGDDSASDESRDSSESEDEEDYLRF